MIPSYYAQAGRQDPDHADPPPSPHLGLGRHAAAPPQLLHDCVYDAADEAGAVVHHIQVAVVRHHLLRWSQAE